LIVHPAALGDGGFLKKEKNSLDISRRRGDNTETFSRYSGFRGIPAQPTISRRKTMKNRSNVKMNVNLGGGAQER